MNETKFRGGVATRPRESSLPGPDCWRALVFAAAVGVLALAVFRGVLRPGTFLFTTDDTVGNLAAGKSALPYRYLGDWNDLNLAGIGYVRTPVTWTSLLLWILPLRTFVNWNHALALVGGSLFLAIYLRGRGIGWLGCFLGAVTAYWLGTNLTLTYAGHIPKFAVVMLMPLALECVRRAAAPTQPYAWSLLAGGVIAFMLIEQQDVGLFCSMFVGLYALFVQIHRHTWRRGLQGLPPLLLSGGVALVTATPVLFASYQLNIQQAASVQAEDSQAKWDFVVQWSQPPDEWIDFLAPGYMGWRSGEPQGPYWGRTGRSAGWEQTRDGFMNFRLETVYLGAIPLALACSAVGGAVSRLRAVRRRTSRTRVSDDLNVVWEILFWTGAALLALLLAFGKYTPVYTLFYQLPLVNSIRCPNKFLQPFQVMVAILAAYGFDHAVRIPSMDRKETHRLAV